MLIKHPVAQPHTMLNFTTSESTFSNMSATEIEKLVLAMPDADSENVSDNLKPSMSVSVGSSVDIAYCEH
jgi:prophage DNA circulation protein